MDDIHREQARDTEPALLDGYAPKLVQEFGACDMQAGANPARAHPVVLGLIDAGIQCNLAPACHLVELAELIGRRYLLTDAPDPGFAIEACAGCRSGIPAFLSDRTLARREGG